MRRALHWMLGLAVLAVITGLGWLGVVPGVRGRYVASTPALAAAFRAKEGCTCVFVHLRDEAACREWTRVDPDVAAMEVDRRGGTVTARALVFWSARARFVGARGCRLE